jgi:hypothetical protein
MDGLVGVKLREFLLEVGIAASAIPETVDGRANCFRSWSRGKRVAVVVEQALSPRQVRMLTPGPGQSVVLATAAGGLDGLRVHDLVTFLDLSPLEDDFAIDLLGRLAGPDRVAGEAAAARELVAMCDGLPVQNTDHRRAPRLPRPRRGPWRGGPVVRGGTAEARTELPRRHRGAIPEKVRRPAFRLFCFSGSSICCNPFRGE